MPNDPTVVLEIYATWTGMSSGTVAENVQKMVPKLSRKIVETNRMGGKVERGILGAFELMFDVDVRPVADGVFAALLRTQCINATLVTASFCLNTAGTASVATPLITVEGYVSEPSPFGTDWGTPVSSNIGFKCNKMTIYDGTTTTVLQ